ncbi:LysR family transcriptional regulator [Rhodobacteraceae bacterium N5(2021)]|uniref:LysR family transcriptional regulator n=1 Tax=Gymnodinialimonas phycosphaerae TaxID=2841589 RepID=A0A975YFW6_9RHOB|nr:LysR family transcriptional regulator [Gymnodinialimonas phycosphaerae]MBY4895253.1 LysR family transcriptional regulator [Gymnodinialimonas phycosphaerae]
MARNLDLTALRAFVTVVDAGGVTKASGFLNLTQSAVSMQLKRLEEALDVALFDRTTRKLHLTGAGEQMLGYARRMLELNDEVLGRLTATEFEGEILLGAPHDVVYPAIPEVLQRFNVAYPRMRVTLLSMGTLNLKAAMERGEADVILTTEEDVDRGGETLLERPMVWVGAKEGQMWKQRPLRLALEDACIFRGPALAALDAAGIPWEVGVEADSIRTVEATVSADLAVHAVIEGTESPYTAIIPHHGALPTLPRIRINMYRSELSRSEPVDALVNLIRQAFHAI